MTRIGVAVVARATFDVAYASELAAAAWERLCALGDEIVGTPELILDDDALRRAASALEGEALDALVIVQATFADATRAAAIADANPAPLVLWAFPEARTGDRLRLNSFCGINLAGYRLTREGRRYRYLYQDPRDPTTGDAISRLLETPPRVIPPITAAPPIDAAATAARTAARHVRAKLSASTVGIVGKHPDGFEPCDFDHDVLAGITGVIAETAPLSALFSRAQSAPAAAADAVRVRVSTHLEGVQDVDSDGLDRSIRLHLGLRQLIDERGWSGVATRCWPECFSEFGAACCAPHAMLNDDGVPGCCEADAYGTVTSLILQWLGGAPAFVADLVDLDSTDQTGVFWHCGLAPLSMANQDRQARATIHTNRNQPLLYEFALRPGRVTIARLSQSRGVTRLTIGGGEMRETPRPYAGTGGVLRFDRPVEEVMDTVLTEGLEHHYGIVYGDVRPELRALAAELGLPIVDL